MAQIDAVQEAASALRKIFEGRNWLIGAPVFGGGVVVLIIVLTTVVLVMGSDFLHIASRAHDESGALPFDFGKFALVWLVAMVLGVTVTMFCYGWEMAAAQPIWHGGAPAFERGFSRAAQKFPQLLLFALLQFLMIAVTAITFVGPIVIGVLAIYAPAFIMLGDKPAIGAIGASFKMASENIGETIILFLALFVVSTAASLAGLALIWIPIVGFVVLLGVVWIISAFRALVIVRFYELLLNKATPIPIVPETSG